MFSDNRIFQRSDPDFPTTPAVQRNLVASGRVQGEGPLAAGFVAGQRCLFCKRNLDLDRSADRTVPACGTCKASRAAQAAQQPKPARVFTDAERSLIAKVHGYMPRTQLLGVLNDRLRSDLGTDVTPHSLDGLHAEIARLPGTSPGGNTGWSSLRKVLAQARRDGTLQRVTEQVINDFAVVFTLSPKHMMRLKEVLLQSEED